MSDLTVIPFSWDFESPFETVARVEAGVIEDMKRCETEGHVISICVDCGSARCTRCGESA